MRFHTPAAAAVVALSTLTNALPIPVPSVNTSLDNAASSVSSSIPRSILNCATTSNGTCSTSYLLGEGHQPQPDEIAPHEPEQQGNKLTKRKKKKYARIQEYLRVCLKRYHGDGWALIRPEWVRDDEFWEMAKWWWELLKDERTEKAKNGGLVNWTIPDESH